MRRYGILYTAKSLARFNSLIKPLLQRWQARPGKKTPPGGGGEAPRLHRTGGEAPCSMKGRKTRREEKVLKGVENLPALLYTIV